MQCSLFFFTAFFLLSSLFDLRWGSQIFMRCLCSAQGLAAVKKLTRSYLGLSASISQAIQVLNVKEIHGTPSTDNPALGMLDSSFLFTTINKHKGSDCKITGSGCFGLEI